MNRKPVIQRNGNAYQKDIGNKAGGKQIFNERYARGKKKGPLSQPSQDINGKHLTELRRKWWGGLPGLKKGLVVSN